MKLSIIIPVFNEEKTIGEIIKKIRSLQIPSVEKEIIIVDDGSSDNSVKIIKPYVAKDKSLRLLIHEKNSGKGSAIKTGVKIAKGDYVAIQDADLEYNPQDFVRLTEPIKEDKAKVVYGTRLKRFPNFSKEESQPRFIVHYLGNKFLSLITSVLYGQWITDMETCYKIFPKSALEKFDLKSRSFDFEPEITAKLLKNGYKITELPINTTPRNYNEGKKLNTLKDGIIALWSLLKYRFID